ncbi:hypothetical protein ABH931_000116 [Streptacidiphilus sp. MAP12-33]|uniref:Dabb family protein n=1 Tax=Streptacidiphilus sp. MAP12-33 TaxID=3156266 RepID=UPI0035197267
MIRHLVLFKLNDGVTKDDPRVPAAVAAFEKVGQTVPELREWQIGWNITDRDIAQDFAINSLVEDAATLQAYLTHPDHVAAAGLWREFATWVIADFEI